MSKANEVRVTLAVTATVLLWTFTEEEAVDSLKTEIDGAVLQAGWGYGEPPYKVLSVEVTVTKEPS